MCYSEGGFTKYRNTRRQGCSIKYYFTSFQESSCLDSNDRLYIIFRTNFKAISSVRINGSKDKVDMSCYSRRCGWCIFGEILSLTFYWGLLLLHELLHVTHFLKFLFGLTKAQGTPCLLISTWYQQRWVIPSPAWLIILYILAKKP